MQEHIASPREHKMEKVANKERGVRDQLFLLFWLYICDMLIQLMERTNNTGWFIDYMLQFSARVTVFAALADCYGWGEYARNDSCVKLKE